MAKGNIVSLSSPFDVWSTAIIGQDQLSGYCGAVIDLAAARADNSTLTIAAIGSGYTAYSYDPETDDEVQEVIYLDGGMRLFVLTVDGNGGVLTYDVDSYGTSRYEGTDLITTATLFINGEEQQTSGTGFKLNIVVDESIVREQDKGVILRGGYGGNLKITSIGNGGSVTGISTTYDSTATVQMTAEMKYEVSGDQVLPEVPPADQGVVWDGDTGRTITDTRDASSLARGRGVMYNVGDTFRVVQPGASGCVCTVTSVDTLGQILTFDITSGGSGYTLYTDPITKELDLPCQQPWWEFSGDIGYPQPGDKWFCVYGVLITISAFYNATIESYPQDGTSDILPSDAKFIITGKKIDSTIDTYSIITPGTGNNYTANDKVWLRGPFPESYKYPLSVTVSAVSQTVPVTTASTSPTNISFQANWQAFTGALNYQLDVAIDQSFTSYVPGYQSKSVSGTSCAVGDLPYPNSIEGVHTYYYRVRAVTESETTGNSNVTTATINTPTVTAMSATEISFLYFQANWVAVTSATKYYLWVSKDNFSTSVEGYDGKEVATLNCEVTGLEYGTSYKYKVKAYINGWITDYSNVITAATPTPMIPPNTTISRVTNPQTGKTEFFINRIDPGVGARDAFQVKVETSSGTVQDSIIDSTFDAPEFTTTASCGDKIRFEVTLPNDATQWYTEICLTEDFEPAPGNSFRSKVLPSSNLSAYFDTLEPSSIYYIRAYSIKTEVSNTTEVSVSKSSYAYTSIQTLADGSICPTAPESVPQDQYFDDKTFFVDEAMTLIRIGDNLTPNTHYSVKLRTYLYNTEGSGSVSNAAWSEWSEPVTFMCPPAAPTARPATLINSPQQPITYLFNANWYPNSDCHHYLLYVKDSGGSLVSGSPFYIDKGQAYPAALQYVGAIFSGQYFVQAVSYDDVNETWEYSPFSNTISYSHIPVALPATNVNLGSFLANWSNTFDAIVYSIDVAEDYYFTKTELNYRYSTETIPPTKISTEYVNVVARNPNNKLLISGLPAKEGVTSGVYLTHEFNNKFYYRVRGRIYSQYGDYSNIIRVIGPRVLSAHADTTSIHLSWA